MSPEDKAQRNRVETRAGILAAVGRLLARSGFGQIGINSIAREAGVDKVLIYRYFGGMPELLKAFAAESDFWPGIEELMQEAGQMSAGDTALDRAKRIMLAFGRALRKRPLTQEIMRWELQEQNELTETLARHREAQSEKLFEQFGDAAGVDVRAVASLLAAGQTYLILRSKNAEVYNGLSLHSETDWRRLEAAAVAILDAVFANTASAEALCTKKELDM
ncbi:MAG: helix-turn-helix domain containing protein [Terracidiphilus sp.]|nr:helix-turn-helix domain containing protein [Terracidiphilus sp.]